MGFKDRSCDVCGRKSETIVDGKTRMGPWALLCVPCHKIHGIGLGPGRGQKWDNRTGQKLEG